MAECLQTVVETPTFLSAAKGVLSDEERTAVVATIATHPTAGISLGGGLRKVRVELPGRGKRGGARVVFLFAGDDLPAFLLTVFAKNERADLTRREQAELVTLAKGIVDEYRRRR